MGSIPGSGRFLGVWHGNPLQYSCLKNSMDREAWLATVHGAAKSRTWLSACACAHAHTHKRKQGTTSRNFQKPSQTHSHTPHPHSLQEVIVWFFRKNCHKLQNTKRPRQAKEQNGFTHLYFPVLVWPVWMLTSAPPPKQYRRGKRTFICTLSLLYPGQQWRAKDDNNHNLPFTFFEQLGQWRMTSFWWHHWSNGHEFEQTPEDGERQDGMLQSMESQRVRHGWETEHQQKGKKAQFLNKNVFGGLPWWLSKESAFQCRRCGSDPWSGKLPCLRATRPVLHKYWPPALKPGSHS